MQQVAILKNRPSSAAPAATANALAAELLRPWVEAYDNWRTGVAGMLERTEAKGDRCSQCGPACGPADCRCSCCVADSDLLIETRLGERRVVPITIENHWRRNRDIELELSSWTKIEGAQINGKVITPTSFTIEPCGSARVMLVIEIGGAGDSKAAAAVASEKATRNVVDNERQPRDVEQCLVGYADLRVKGCDIRPIRIAVAVLPHHCDDYVVDCCTACC